MMYKRSKRLLRLSREVARYKLSQYIKAVRANPTNNQKKEIKNELVE